MIYKNQCFQYHFSKFPKKPSQITHIGGEQRPYSPYLYLFQDKKKVLVKNRKHLGIYLILFRVFCHSFVVNIFFEGLNFKVLPSFLNPSLIALKDTTACVCRRFRFSVFMIIKFSVYECICKWQDNA